MINLIPLSYRILGGVGIVLALILSGYLYGRHVQGIKDDANIAQERLTWTQAVADGQAAIASAVIANDALKTKLEVQHAQANHALNILLSHPAPGVQLPACVSSASSGQVDAASGSELQAAGSERAANSAQAAFDEAQRGMEADAAEWSRALNACAVVIEWADK